MSPIFLHETFYALMQGYDAVAMQTDVQVGGTDQLFNIIVAGRKLQEALGQRPLVGIITGILPGTDGVLRMSKSTGNVIPIDTTAGDMYGKVMSLPDSAMLTYFQLLSRYTPAQVAALEPAWPPARATRATSRWSWRARWWRSTMATSAWPGRGTIQASVSARRPAGRDTAGEF